jgi:hypothetical protein
MWPIVVPAGAPSHAIPPPAADHARDVERIGRHCEFATVSLPGTPRSIGVDLDPQTVWIPQVQRLANQVIGRANPHAAFREMCGESSKRGAPRQQDREVIQAECSASSVRYAWARLERQEWTVVTMRA